MNGESSNSPEQHPAVSVTAPPQDKKGQRHQFKTFTTLSESHRADFVKALIKGRKAGRERIPKRVLRLIDH